MTSTSLPFGLSLKEELVELSLDIDAILAEIIAAFLDCAKKRAVDDNLLDLASLFTNRSDTFKALVRRVDTRVDRQEYLKQMNETVKKRGDVIAAQVEKLTEGLKIVSDAHFEALKAVRKAKTQAKNFTPEEIIKFSHQISKNFSVASPHFWQQGDPMRPFPTELHFRASSLALSEGIKDPKELSILSSTSKDNVGYETLSTNVINRDDKDNDQDELMDIGREESMVPASSSSSVAHQVVHDTNLMSSEEDDSDDDD